MQIYSGTKAGATKFVTSGVDGRVVIWDVKVNFKKRNSERLSWAW